MRINTNMGALQGARQLGVNNSSLSKSLEKLSSGLRINKASDDTAGLAIATRMKSAIRGLKQAARNAQDGISLLQTAESALATTSSVLQRMGELATQASSATMQDSDRAKIQGELNTLGDTLDKVANNTTFNGKALLNGSFGLQLDKTTTTLNSAAQGQLTATMSGGSGVTGLQAYNAQVDQTLTLSQDTTAQTLTLSNLTTGKSQTLSFDDTAATAGVELDFTSFGVKFTADDSSTDLGGETITTAANQVTSFSFDGAKAGTTYTIGNAAAGTFTLTAAGGVTGVETIKVDQSAKFSGTLAFKDFGVSITLSGANTSAANAAGLNGKMIETTDQNEGVMLIGAYQSQTMGISIASATAKDLGVAGVDVSDSTKAQTALTKVQTAIDNVSRSRSSIGSMQNSLEDAISSVDIQAENLEASRSRIEDVDMAQEITQMTKFQILSQAGTAMLAQANQIPQGVLKLLG